MESVSSFQTGPDQEKDVVAVETLLMKLASVELTLSALQQYADDIAANDGQEADNTIPPDQWAVAGAYQNLVEISHALKCGCWGYKAAHIH